MFNIEKYLERFKKLGESEKESKEKIIAVLFGVLNIRFSADDLEIKNAVLIIKCNPVVKNSLYIKKEKILEAIKGVTGKRIIDIR
jgi:hypothetical protein